MYKKNSVFYIIVRIISFCLCIVSGFLVCYFSLDGCWFDSIIFLALVVFFHQILLFTLLRKQLNDFRLIRLIDNEYLEKCKSQYFFYGSSENFSISSIVDNDKDWIDTDIKMSSFPGYISKTLKKTRNELFIVGIEKNRRIISIHSFVDNDLFNKSNIDNTLRYIYSRCQNCDASSVIRIHVYPRQKDGAYINPYNTSKCEHYFDNLGLNWFDFACIDSKPREVNRHFSWKSVLYDQFYFDYIDKLSVTSLMNYRIQMKYLNIFMKYRRHLLWIVCTIVVALLCLNGITYIDFSSSEHSSKKKNSSIETEEVIEETIEETAQYIKIDITEATSDSHYSSNKGNIYTVDCLYDGDMTTCWQDGVDGDGIGEQLSFWFETSELKRIQIVNGNRTRDNSFYENNRLETITIEFFLDDKRINKIHMTLDDDASKECDQIEFGKALECNKVVITIDTVYSGTVYSDTGISEIEFFEYK